MQSRRAPMFIATLVAAFALGACTEETPPPPPARPAEPAPAAGAPAGPAQPAAAQDFEVTPIAHATAVLRWGEAVIYVDPVGGGEAFAAQEPADLVLVTDIHPDHLNVDTLAAVLGEAAALVAPRAVVQQLPEALAARAVTLDNGETTEQAGLHIEAIPMYNLPPGEDAFHPKGRGNGYLLEGQARRVYIAGDTEAVPEMRALEDIDIAFVPMNLPYTMTVEEAADGVLAFAPDKVYPYHFRGQDGYSDVEKFKSLVEQGNPDIEVELLDWYPGAET